jgi:hypothetical protein
MDPNDDANAAPVLSSSDEDDSIWGDLEADSGLAGIDDVDADDDADEQDAIAVFDFARIYRAIESGKTPEELRSIIRDVSKGSGERRREAVNQKLRVRERNYYDSHLSSRWIDEPALHLAHDLKRWQLAGVLAMAGADLRPVFPSTRITRLAACAAYGYAPGVSKLLKKNGHDANKKMGRGRTAAHLALSNVIDPNPGQVACVEVLVSQGKADVEARDDDGDSVLLKLATWDPTNAQQTLAALDLFVRKLKADIEAKNTKTGRSLIFAFCGPRSSVAVLSALLETYGASADVSDTRGVTPLMEACVAERYGYTFGHGWGYSMGPNQEVAETLLKASSVETRRATRRSDGKSAVDMLVEAARARVGAHDPLSFAASFIPAWERQVIAQLVSSGAPVKAENRSLAEAIVAAVSLQQPGQQQG